MADRGLAASVALKYVEWAMFILKKCVKVCYCPLIYVKHWVFVRYKVRYRSVNVR